MRTGQRTETAFEWAAHGMSRVLPASKRAQLPLGLLLLATTGAGCAKPVLTVYDTAIRENGSVRLLAAVDTQKGILRRDPIPGQSVEYFIEGRRVGQGVTSAHGEADVVVNLGSKASTRYEVRASVEGARLSETGVIFSLPPRRVGIVLDIDHTLSNTRYLDLMTGHLDLLSKPLHDSAAVLKRLTPEYDVAYLTARPRVLFGTTREWLDRNGFPKGPLLVSRNLREMRDAGEYKSRAIAQGRRNFPNFLIGIGDKDTDAAAYTGNGMLAIIIGRRSGKDYGDALALEDWDALERFFQANHALLTDPERIRRVVDEGGLRRARLESGGSAEIPGPAIHGQE